MPNATGPTRGDLATLDLHVLRRLQGGSSELGGAVAVGAASAIVGAFERRHLYQSLGFTFERQRLSLVDLHLGLTCHITQSFVFGLCQRFEALGR